jgi:integrase
MVRKSELQEATWDEVDFENAVWTIPKERMKRSKAHNVYLSQQCIDIMIGSCPKPWCSFGGVITAISGWAGSGQAATAGRLTRASSLSGAKLSSGM